MRLQPTSARIADIALVRAAPTEAATEAATEHTTVAAVGGLASEVGLVAVVAAYIGYLPAGGQPTSQT